jgi:diguanylate cyclase (GGDEF)-like protein
MSTLFRYINRASKYFFSQKNIYNDAEEIRKIYLINIFSLIAFMFAFPLGINAYMNENYLLSAILVFVSFILIINYFYFRYSNNKIGASYIISALLFLLFLYLLYTGGADNTGALWVYPLPLVMMFLLGIRLGLLFVSIFFILAIYILFILDVSIYTDTFKLRFIFSLFVVTFLASVYEYLRESTFEKISLLSHKLEELSQKDYLTQVYNRRGIDKEINNICKYYKTEKKNFSLLICDIDDFKKINDGFGHDAGDEVLKKVALEIGNIIRKEDLIARWGGEEFLVLLPNSTIDDAYEVGEKIRKSIENTSFQYAEHNISMTVSIGIAAKEDTLPISDIIRKADTHMYTAKKEGRNTVYPKV